MQKNCPKCKKKDIKLNGKNNNGKQKFKYKNCNHCFIKKSKTNDIIRGDKIFNDWLCEGYSSRQLGLQKSKNTLDIINIYQRKIK